MLKKVFALLLALAMLWMMAVPVVAEEEALDNTAGYYYVYTENGKGLNVRATAGGTIVGSLKYGSRVYCYYKDGGTGWALIDFAYDMPGYGYGTYACYVSTRFLQKSKPPARPTSSSTANTPAKPAATAEDGVEALNKEYRSAKKVEPFAVTVRPTRVSGWVNLRWGPSKETEIMATYKANDTLLVIQELDNWYQVEDQDTGDVGFVNKQFVSK